MIKPIEAKRLYSISDADAIEAEKTILGCFKEDQTDFSAFDSKFVSPYEQQWQTEIETAEAEGKDETLMDEMQSHTAAVTDAMELCRQKFQKARYFIEKAYPKNKAVWKEFGYDDYKKARQNQSEMIQFMKVFAAVAEKRRADLERVGYKNAEINEIATLKEQLDNANNVQELFKKNRRVLTQTRIDNLNKPWQRLLDVCKAAKYIYADNFGKLSKYKVPLQPDGDEEEGGGNPVPPQP